MTEEDKQSVEAEFQMATYKLDNGQLKEAEDIFLKLALAYKWSDAWIGLGLVNFTRVQSGEGTVAPALHCFMKAKELDPSRIQQFQSTYCQVSINTVKQLYNYYQEAKKELSKASRKMWGNVLLGGAAVMLGSNARNKTFGTIAGAAGAGLGGYHMNKNIHQKRDAKQLLAFYQQTMKQLIEGMNTYCADNQSLHQEFMKAIQ